jgi:phosphoribosylanthranilate isomerase
VRVKVCGITSYEDAAMALDQGIDVLGFNFFVKSSRYIDPLAARSIIQRLPPFVTAVGLFVNQPEAGDVAKAAQEAGVRVLQLHGDESPEYCRRLSSWTVIKVLRLDGRGVTEDLGEYSVQAFLLDSRDDDRFGGTGLRFDWSLVEPVRAFGPVILAGGLKPENVAEAIRSVRPYAVDVCSGVESVPGRKDKGKLAAFMKEVRNACEDL